MSKIAIVGAIPEEIDFFKDRYGKEVVIGLTGVGKSNSASTTQKIISEHWPDAIIFTGVAGALDSKLHVGDLGVAVSAIDADLDVRAWDKSYMRGEIPFTRERVFYSNKGLVDIAFASGADNLFRAYIATGSKFLDKPRKLDFLENEHPELAAEIDGETMLPNIYDMESSAFLQVANMNKTPNRGKTPAIVLRVVSDDLNGNAPQDFNNFIKKSVRQYVRIVDAIYEAARPLPLLSYKLKTRPF